MLALAAVAGCSQDPDDKRQPSGVTAEHVCDSALDARAAAALRRLAGVERFTELTGTNDSGEPYRFSLKRAAAHLHDVASARNRCGVYKAGDKSGKPLLEVDFEASEKYPNRSEAAGDEDLSLYPIGRYASTRGSLAANLFFSCASGSAKGDTRYVKATMFSSGDQLAPGATGKDRMTVLTSVARALSRELGCPDEAHLPSTVPDASP